MLAVCPSGLSYSVGNVLLPSSVYAQSNAFLCELSLYNITYMLVCIIMHFYYIVYVYNWIVYINTQYVCLCIQLYMFVVLIDAFEKYGLC